MLKPTFGAKKVSASYALEDFILITSIDLIKFILDDPTVPTPSAEDIRSIVSSVSTISLPCAILTNLHYHCITKRAPKAKASKAGK